MIFKKKARIPRKEKKRRARMLHPIRKIKFTPYPGLTYAKLEQVILDALFGPEAEKKFKEQFNNMMIYGMVPINPIRTEKLTLDEIKERFSITEKEEEALRAQIGLGSGQDIQTNEERKVEGS